MSHSFIKISSNFAGNVYEKHACPKFWPHFEKQNEKQNGCHSQLFEKHNDALNLEILQLDLSHLHK